MILDYKLTLPKIFLCLHDVNTEFSCMTGVQILAHFSYIDYIIDDYHRVNMEELKFFLCPSVEKLCNEFRNKKIYTSNIHKAYYIPLKRRITSNRYPASTTRYCS
jgi:hypothetical protein